MKWGVRKASGGGGRESRKEYRARTAQESQAFYGKKASTIAKAAEKGGDKVLIKTRLPGDPYQTITTGTEFMNHLKRGGAFDVKVSEIFANLDKKADQFVLDDNPIGAYQKTARRK